MPPTQQAWQTKVIPQFTSLNTSQAPTLIGDDEFQLLENFDLVGDAGDSNVLAVPTLIPSVLNNFILNTNFYGTTALRHIYEPMQWDKVNFSTIPLYFTVRNVMSVSTGYVMLMDLSLSTATRIAAAEDWGFAPNRYVGSVLTLINNNALINSANWTVRNAASTNTWNGIGVGTVSGSKLFVAVASTGTGTRVMTSPDGVTWTTRTSAADVAWQSVCSGTVSSANLFVAVSNNGTTANTVMTSPDGITWTLRAVPANCVLPWTCVVWANNLFVASYSQSGTDSILYPTTITYMTSPDGITWTLRQPYTAVMFTSSPIYAVNNYFIQFVSSFSAPAGGPKMAYTYSTDGINWVFNTPTLPLYTTTYYTNSMTYGSGIYVFVYAGGVLSTTNFASSVAVWNNSTTPANNTWTSVSYGNGLFMAVSSTGIGNRSIYSTDGVAWSILATPSDIAWIGLVFSNNTFVALSNNGTLGSVMTSASITQVQTAMRAFVGLQNKVYVYLPLIYGTQSPNQSIGTVSGLSVTYSSGTVFTANIAPGSIITFSGITTGGDDGNGGFIVAAVTPTTLLLYTAPGNGSYTISWIPCVQITFGGAANYFANHISWFKSRLWACTSGNRLYFTNLPAVVFGSTSDSLSTNYYDFIEGDIGDLVATHGWGGRLLIFCKNAIYTLTGDPSKQAIISLMAPGIGLLSQSTICPTPYGIVFADQYGQLRLTDGQSVLPKILSNDVRNSFVITPNGTKMFYHDDHLIILTQTSRTGAFTNYPAQWAYRFSLDKWFNWPGVSVQDGLQSITYPYFNVTSGNSGLPEHLYISGTSIYEFQAINTTPTIQGRFQTKDFTLDDPNAVKVIDRLSFDLYNCYAGVVITCTPVMDGVAMAALAKTYLTTDHANQTTFFQFKQAVKGRRISFLVSFTALGNSQIGLLGNMKFTYMIIKTNVDGGFSPSQSTYLTQANSQLLMI